MQYVMTTGHNADFAALCVLLDESLEEAVGATVQRSKYKQFNTLEKIKDAVRLDPNDDEAIQRMIDSTDKNAAIVGYCN